MSCHALLQAATLPQSPSVQPTQKLSASLYRGCSDLHLEGPRQTAISCLVLKVSEE